MLKILVDLELIFKKLYEALEKIGDCMKKVSFSCKSYLK